MSPHSSSRPPLQIVEVAPRDGFQPVAAWIETDTKNAFVRRLASSGLRRIEVASFVSPVAVPQMRDAREVLAAALAIPGLRAQVLIPTAKHGSRAVAAGATDLAYVISASDAHNRANVRRTVKESVCDYRLLTREIGPEVTIRINLATSFDCPFNGEVSQDAVLRLVEELIAPRDSIELALCDTTGRATPDRVSSLAKLLLSRFPDVLFAFHGHDTFGLGVANVFAAYDSGIDVFDASAGGLGGCPFAPGATGNVATEDVVWMFERMGINTGIDISALIAVADDLAAIPGASSGGRVRTAVRSCSMLGNRDKSSITARNCGDGFP